jgi:ADP-heptose:LPS heptosyltransferase
VSPEPHSPKDSALQAANSFLVVRLGAIGDALRVFPMVRRLRRERPDAHIGWAVEDWVHPALAPSEDIDQFHVLRRGELRAGGFRALREWRRFLSDIRSTRYEVALDVHGRFKSGIVTRGSRARWRLGYVAGQETELNHWFTNVRVRLDDPEESRVLRFLHLLEPLGISCTYDPAENGLPLTRDVVERAEAWYEGAGRPHIAAFPGSSQHQAGYNRWPEEKWVSLLRRLVEDGLRAVVFWGPAEKAFATTIAERVGTGCTLGPEKTLPEFMAILGRFPVFIGSNTAAMHMAWMQGVPTAFFCGPPEPRTHAPLPPVPYQVLRADEKVRPGISKKRQPEVVSAVPVEDAHAAVHELLNESRRSHPRPHPMGA